MAPHTSETHNRAKSLAFLILAAILGFLLWGYFASEGLVATLESSLEAYAEENQFAALSIFFLFAALSVLLGPFTSAPLVPVAILLWGNWITFLLLVSGWIVGGMGAYGIGRYAGYPLVARLLSDERLEMWHNFVSQRLTFFAALLFRLAMPAETGYVFGIVKYNVVYYIIISVLVEIPIAAVLVFASDALVASDFARFVGWVAAVVLVLAGASYLFHREIKRSR